MNEVVAQNATETEPFPKAPKLIDLEAAAQGPFSRGLLSFILPPIEKIFSIGALNRYYAQYYEKVIACKEPKKIFQTCLEVFDVKYSLKSMDLGKIPSEGPLVVVANHPFGGIEGVILGAMLLQVRSDVKILANYLLKRITGIGDTVIAVDPFEKENSVASNLKGLKESIRWVKAGGALITFPSGEVSSFHMKNKRVVDPVWSAHVGGIIRRTRASALPVYFPGKNSLPFQLLGILHQRLRTAMLPREMVNKAGREINVYVGKAIPSRKLQRFETDALLINYLRFNTYFLKNREDDNGGDFTRMMMPGSGEKKMQPIIDPISHPLLSKEVAHLPTKQCLVSNGDLSVHIARSSQIPNVMNEIGRLREITFREVEEGTGNSIDLDRFDSYYRHLFLWNHAGGELVGAYRLGLTDEILKQYGPKGLYTNQLFRFKPEFVRCLSTAIELGRSFIRSEYQKKLSSLLLLWKGIGEFLIRHPHYNILFGPVSISRDYHAVSRNLIVQFLKVHKFDSFLSRFVLPRKPYRSRRIMDIDSSVFQSSLQDIDDISLLISEIEKDGKGIPVLLRQYLKLNGQLISFNLDKSFSNVVDGLLLVDVPHNDPKLIKKWLGQKGYDRIARQHGLPAGEGEVRDKIILCNHFSS